MRLAFVVQRYGLDLAGGAEYHCRLVAEHLARHAQVEVLTTCAADYVTWANHYREGVETLNGVPVRRFKVKHPRDPLRFSDWTDRVMRHQQQQPPGGHRGGATGGHWGGATSAVAPPGSVEAGNGSSRQLGSPSKPPSRAKPWLPGTKPPAPEAWSDCFRWLEEEGPFSPRLVRHIARHARDFDAVIFFSYRYYTTYHGLRAAPSKALLVPTAEDDGVYRLPIFPPLFRLPRAIVWNSLEERAMIQAASGNHDVPGDVVGVGSALPDPARLDPDGFRRRHGLDGPFLLYVGRIDENKGCRQLFDFFLRYKRETGSALTLALIGKAVIPVPEHPAIRPLGFLPDAEKWDALAACDLLSMPSRYESLSMVTLEAWWAQRPVLANARCDVLRGQCQRSRAGLYYMSYDEFAECLALLERDPGLRAALGRSGRRYYDAHYAWDVIERKYLDLLRPVVGARA